MRKILVVVGVLVVVVLGFWFISNMTGNVITGAVLGNRLKMNSEYFKIDSSNETNDTEDLNGTQNSSG